MCGIAGRSSFKPLKPLSAQDLSDRMQQALFRRGPDGGGAHHDSDLLLAHRRLAILDLSHAGAQPMWNEDRSVCVIVNGEIYNFRELRDELESQGHRFRSRSDSEILVHLYEERGIDGCCAAIEGMFAFALWDARSRDLYLVRDRLGIKPLVIAEHGEGVTFGSTIPALMADPTVPRDVRPEAFLALLKWGFVPSPWSSLRAARRVMPGTWLRIRAGCVEEERRWWTDAPAEQETTDVDIREAVSQAVRSHLVADVPVGSLLSAGVDSGLVTALAARHAGSDGVEAWTVSHRGFSEDEFPEASRAAKHFGIKLHEIPVGGGLTEDVFDAVVAGMDEPLAISSLVGLHGLFRAIAPERRVVLSGDGGDELFAGYDWHSGMPAVPGWARSGAFQVAAPLLAKFSDAKGMVGSLGNVAAHLKRHPASVYLDKLRVASDDELRALGIDPQFDDPMENAAIAAWDRFEGAGELEQMLAVDRATALVDEMLAKVDTASMAYSVESRVPLLADRVIEAAKGLDSSRKRGESRGKVCLREWYAELGPDGASARAKTGFNLPLSAWFEGPARELLLERAAQGAALTSAEVAEAGARTMFALAVLGSWRPKR